ncbi:hypothetical protein IIA95_00720 [Patescibacteria group bacterium]|nr:hypothetical protein [Patescibacteria group bacterium]
MEIVIKNLPKSEVEITGEITADDFERSFQKTLLELNAKANIPGFRAGKIPENILLDKIGMGNALERAAEISLQENYPKILQKHNIDAIDQPRITITKLARNNPLGFKAIIAILPSISLPTDYKMLAQGIMKQKENITIEEKEIADALEYLRKSRTKNQAPGTQNPEPELNDEFAKKIGQPDLQSLKNLLRTNIREDKEREAREKKRMETMDKIAGSTPIDIPDVLMHAEKSKMLGELKASIENMGLNWKKYLDHIKKSEENLQKEWQEEAGKRVRYALVLREIARIENINPSEEEIESHITRMISAYPESERKKIDKARLKDYAYGVIRNEKVFQLLES